MILLEELNTEFGNIKIIRSRSDGTCTYYQEDCFHSQINREGISTCSYVHIMYGIILQAKARRVLMIGCAGGTLATMLYRAGCHVTVVDINPHAFTLAKRYFQMPEQIKCIAEDGRYYLHKTTERYDAIAIDAFDSIGSVPQHLIDDTFFHTLGNALAIKGVVVMNIMVAHDLDLLADRIALNIESAKLPTVLFDTPGRTDRNTIVAGGNVENIKIPCGKEPMRIRYKLRGTVCRKPNRQAATAKFNA